LAGITLDELYIALHPVRRRLLMALFGSGKFTSELVNESGFSKRLVRFHMEELEKAGLVSSEYREVGKGRIGRYYFLTEKGRYAVKLMREIGSL